MRKNSRLFTVAGVAAVVSMLACSGSPSSSPGSGSNPGAGNGQAAAVTTVAVGQAIVIKDGSVETTVVVASIDAKAKSDNQFTQPKRGQFVAISVEITATKGSSDLGPSNFRFVAADGNVYLAEILVVGIEPQLDAMTKVEQGQKKSGKVVFDADPAKVIGGKVEVRTDGGDPVGYWTT